jgi:homoserine dehydrogenase
MEKVMQRLSVGIIGLGTVGKEVVRILRNFDPPEVELKKIAEINPVIPKDLEIPPCLLTNDATELLEDKEIRVIVELIGGIEPARSYILRAMENGKDVVTANKALLAQDWELIHSAAVRCGVRVLFEAAVGGGIPIIRSIRTLLNSNHIQSIFGIINGTCNYILTQMEEKGKGFNEVLEEAKALGYAEADPSLDISGEDTAHKLAILSSLIFGGVVRMEDIYIEGIEKITHKDITYAWEEFGYRIKLLGIAKRVNGGAEVRVHPTMIPKGHLLSSIGGIYNAIYLCGDNVGPLLFYGQGAGGMTTASSVVSDLLYLAQTLRKPLQDYKVINRGRVEIKRIEELVTKYYVRFTALDQPGVLASISSILAKNGISIASVIQKERKQGEVVPIVMLTHEAKEKRMMDAIREIDKLDVVKERSLVIRCEEMVL